MESARKIINTFLKTKYSPNELKGELFKVGEAAKEEGWTFYSKFQNAKGTPIPTWNILSFLRKSVLVTKKFAIFTLCLEKFTHKQQGRGCKGRLGARPNLPQCPHTSHKQKSPRPCGHEDFC